MQESPHSGAAIAEAITACRAMPGPLLPLLHALQDRLGHVPKEAVPIIARELNLSRAEVHGVVTFYHHFRSSPPGKHVVRLCRAEACQAMGAVELVSHAKTVLGIDFHETTADGQITLEPVYCLGNCACSPAMMVDDDLYGRVTADRFEAVVKNLRAAP